MRLLCWTRIPNNNYCNFRKLSQPISHFHRHVRHVWEQIGQPPCAIDSISMFLNEAIFFSKFKVGQWVSGLEDTWATCPVSLLYNDLPDHLAGGGHVWRSLIRPRVGSGAWHGRVAIKHHMEPVTRVGRVRQGERTTWNNNLVRKLAATWKVL